MSKPSMGKGIALLSVGLLISLGTFFSGSPIFLVAVGPIGVGIANIIGALRMSNLCPRCGFRGAQHQRHDGVVCRQMYRFRDNDARAVSGPTRAIATSLRAKVLRGVGPRDFQPRRSPGFRHSDWVNRPGRDSNRIGLGPDGPSAA